MDITAAAGLWNDAVRREFGIDNEGNMSDQLTGLGGAALGSGAPLYAYCDLNDEHKIDHNVRIGTLLRSMADALSGANHTFSFEAQGWNRVDHVLPTHDMPVLVSCIEGVRVGTLRRNKTEDFWTLATYGEYKNRNITHWTHLPDPAKE